MLEELCDYHSASWKRRFDAEEPNRNVHTFSTPPPLEILKLLPVAYRVGSYIYTERSNGREPIFDMSGIQLQPPNPGPYAGVPLGGMGSGSIGRGYRGDFRRWSLNPGRYAHQVVHADSFAVRVKHGHNIKAKVLSMIPPDDTSCMTNWKYDLNPSCATYYARFPFAWTVYEDPVSHVKVIVRQLSPFIPGNYSESCLPASVFDVVVENHQSGGEDVEVSIMFTFQNGMNEENSKRNLYNFHHEVFEVSSKAVLSATTAEEASAFASEACKIQEQSIQGIQMMHTCRFESGKQAQAKHNQTAESASFSSFCANQSSENISQPVISLDTQSFAIACSTDTASNAATNVSFCPKFQSLHSRVARQATENCFSSSAHRELLELEKEHADAVWKQFYTEGSISDLSQYLDSGKDRSMNDNNNGGERFSAAICMKRIIQAQKSSTFRFALAWDYPIARFGSGYGLPRYYTRFFGKSGDNAAEIASYALQRVDSWETDILKWQAATLSTLQTQLEAMNIQPREVSFYQSQIFNELYFLVDGGTIWTDSTKGVSNQGNKTLSKVISTQPPSDPELLLSAVHNAASAANSHSMQSNKTRFLSSLLHPPTAEDKHELQKSLLDPYPSSTVTTTESLTPTSPHVTKPSSVANIILWEDLLKISMQMNDNNALVEGCGGNQAHVGQFLYLEGHEYLMYNTYDVHFYSSFALIMLWPELELSLQRDIADSVRKEDATMRVMMGEGDVRPRKVKNVVPHDVGSPSETPWMLPNVYNFQDVSNWKDLGTKFVLQVYRDYRYMQLRSKNNEMMKFLRDMYDVVCIVMRHEESFDVNQDGMIENSGFPDQTYDIWTANGVHAYCGGLWITACEAMVAMATLMEDTAVKLHYESLANRARIVYIDHLWDPKNHYFHYDNSNSVHADSIMSDMLAGQWYARACGLPNLVSLDKILSSLRTIFKWNVQAFGRQTINNTRNTNHKNIWRGAVNGTRPIRDPNTHQIIDMQIDNTCLQSREVWTGTTYALAATMLQEALSMAPNSSDGKQDNSAEKAELLRMSFQTAQGIHDGGWQTYGYWFATPEAWEKTGHYRSLGYMRALAIWSMQYAVEQQTHSK